MPLVPGTKLGPYEIVGPLGAGGMGEVYRARDTRLDRSVAIKILPVQFSSDPVHKQRFEREAKTISALNHPHICMLFDIGHQNGIDYLVMEYVEGETLAKRLEKGPLPLEQVLKYGAHIADALDKAHRAGIVHRDLKPGNIMLTATGAKLLDFGLAKPAVPLVSEATLTAVATSPVTQKGAIVGTFQYMSPEQIEGKEVDGRSDIFSLGAVLYEIVTGKRAFEGKGQLSVVSAILEKEPEPITAIKPMTPAALDHAIKKCLAKSADERWQSANDVKLELQWVAERGSEADAMARPGGLRMGWGLAGSLLAAVLLLVMLGGAVVLRIREQQPTRAMHFESHLPFETNDVALSPDGRVVALVAYSDQANKYMIWTHEVGSQVQAPVTGTEGASHPFWSPDAGFIAFFADGKLKKTDAFGRSVQVLCDAPNGRGGTWNRDGIILFSPDVFEGLYRVPANGGTPVEVTRVDLSGLNFSHRWPRFLPDGKHFLYLGANFTGRFERDSILLGSLESAESRLIVHASSNAAYAEPGYLLYRGEKGLVAHRFDLRSYTLQGDPLTINIEAQYFANIDLTLFDVASKEILVAQTGKGAAKSQFVWFDRNGKRVGAAGPPGSLSNPSLSPDGRRVAFDQMEADGHRMGVWIYDLASDAATRFTLDPSLNQTPTWSPDGKRIVFTSNRRPFQRLYLKNADGSGPEQEATDLGAKQQAVWDWSRDGKDLLVRKDKELWVVAMPDGQAQPFLQGNQTVRNAQFSPDGKWVAYSTNETGTWEVYVSPFPKPDSKWQVSRDGGEQPRWRGDGRELFFLSAGGKIMSATVNATSSFEAGLPVALFQTHTRQSISSVDLFSYTVTRDGQRFLVNTRVDEPSSAPLSVILNWASEMQK